MLQHWQAFLSVGRRPRLRRYHVVAGLLLLSILTPMVEAQSVLNMRFKFGFFPDQLAADRLPTVEEVNSMLCQTNSYLTATFRTATNNSAVEAVATHVFWQYPSNDPDNDNQKYPYVMDFIPEVTTNDGSPAPPLKDLQDGFKPLLDVSSFLENYVRKSEPLQQNFFYQVNAMPYSLNEGERKDGTPQIERSQCGESTAAPGVISNTTNAVNGTTALAANTTPAPQSTTDAVLNMRFSLGFSPGQLDPGRMPTVAEVNAMLCQSNAYLTETFQLATNNSAVEAAATHVFWQYPSTDPNNDNVKYPFVLDFIPEVTTTDGSPVPELKDLQIGFLPLLDVSFLLENYIWKSEPVKQNFFSNANVMNYTLNQGPRLPGTAQLERSVCDNNTFAPTALADTFAPTALAMGENATFAPTVASIFGGNLTANETTTSAPSSNDTTSEIQVDDGEGYLGVSLRLQIKREPTDAEVEGLVCRTNQFLVDTLRQQIGPDQVLDSSATNVDWKYLPGSTPDVGVSLITFVSDTYTNASKVDASLYYNATIARMRELQSSYETYYLANSGQGDAFAELLQMTFNGAVIYELPAGKLEKANCVGVDVSQQPSLRPSEAPSLRPSVSAAPTASIAPSSPPSHSPAPTLSLMPSSMPSHSQAPSGLPTTVPSMLPENIFGHIGGNFSAVSSNASAVDDSTGGASSLPINVSFIVSNMDGMTDPDEVRNSGLQAWEPFVEEMVQNVSKSTQRMMRGRRLAIFLRKNSAVVEKLDLTDCGENTRAGLTCHKASATYDLFARDETDSETEITNKYKSATDAAIDDGTFQAVMWREYKNSPLYIGTLHDDGTGATDIDAPSSAGDPRMPVGFLVFLILLLIVLCLCLHALCYNIFSLRHKQTKDEEPYQDGGFAMDLLIPKDDKIRTEAYDKSHISSSGVGKSFVNDAANVTALRDEGSHDDMIGVEDDGKAVDENLNDMDPHDIQFPGSLDIEQPRERTESSSDEEFESDDEAGSAAFALSIVDEKGETDMESRGFESGMESSFEEADDHVKEFENEPPNREDADVLDDARKWDEIVASTTENAGDTEEWNAIVGSKSNESCPPFGDASNQNVVGSFEQTGEVAEPVDSPVENDDDENWDDEPDTNENGWTAPVVHAAPGSTNSGNGDGNGDDNDDDDWDDEQKPLVEKDAQPVGDNEFVWEENNDDDGEKWDDGNGDESSDWGSDQGDAAMADNSDKFRDE